MAKKNLPADYWRAKSDERREAKKPPLWDSEVIGQSGQIYDNAKIDGVDKLDPPTPEFTREELDDYSFLWAVFGVGLRAEPDAEHPYKWDLEEEPK